MASPLTTGLVHRVIGQSPSGGCVRLERALRAGQIPLTRGESGFWRRWVSRIREGSAGSHARIVARGDNCYSVFRRQSQWSYYRWLGSAGRAGASFCAREYNRVPVMMGALAEEYFGLQAGAAEISEADLDAFLTAALGWRACSENGLPELD